MPLPKTTPRTLPLGGGELHDLSRGRIWRAIRTARDIGPRRLIALLRAHGLRKSGDFVVANIRHMIAHRFAVRWDRRHGVDTAGSIQLQSLTVTGPNKALGNECLCTSPKSFDFMLRALPNDLADCAFVDIGAGKSRTLLLASRYGFGKIVGVEFAAELVACSRRNIACFASDWRRRRDIEIVETDATQFDFPETPLVIFFYNPFTRAVFEAVLNNIVASLTAEARRCYIIYASSSHDAIDWAKPAILATRLFDEIPSAPMPWFLDAVRPVRYAVFRNK